MSGPSKIATCCYCGTRAALVLKGKERHELSCSSCGAPLHDLKMLPKRKAEKTKPARPAVSHVVPPKAKRKKKKKSMFSRVFDEAWDVIEDIFD
ncbi:MULTISPECIES: hypothetical protein [unclassified Ruegeria]|uniref:hypothetical protein n=1 Tax=unclassified Ruegeria TaxID=2625375 RepID=UPI001488AC1A|nr:hypothetical protein [Ruegeria sp. HKCCD4332]NOD88558.1 hypothetical protein [Ruegeria sp. HKCCD4318]NOE12214.1 hypothetical protein [Ruegeria sp. HKCCD4318-2]NOG09621.1 hypothetical protein [Ruegeria sp. HKCCD4315]